MLRLAAETAKTVAQSSKNAIGVGKELFHEVIRVENYRCSETTDKGKQRANVPQGIPCAAALSAEATAAAAAAAAAATTTTTTTVHSSLSSGPIDYARGWAWQQVLLHQRHLRRLEQRPHDEHIDHNHLNSTPTNTILVLEHNPVYTLGRGADESNIQVDIPDRHRLARQPLPTFESARLVMDKKSQTHCLESLSTMDSVQSLSQIASPVITPQGVPIYRIDRGGEVTFHGPGQLVVYPMLDLTCHPFKPDLHWYLRQLEQVIIDTLQHDYDIPTMRDSHDTGVWYQPPSPHQPKQKIAAVGVSASRWITTHGFSLNVRPALEYFDESYIIPCGLRGKPVTSMEQILKQQQKQGRSCDWTTAPELFPTVPQVAQSVLNKMETVFGINIDKQAIIEIQ